MTFPSLLLALTIALSLDAIEQIRCGDGADSRSKVNFPRKFAQGADGGIN
jgi:hypothetical protein